MRPIKFRAWNPNLKKMMPVITSLLADDGNFQNLASGWIVMQFTGLLDMNGKEIYEGDIVSYTPWISGIIREENPWNKGVVGWSSEKARFTMDKEDIWGMIYGANSMLVIGNFYENQELLK